MDQMLKYKQIALKFGIPLFIVFIVFFIIFYGSSTKNDNQALKNNDNSMSLFNEDELVSTRYADSIEDKLNTAVSSQDTIKEQNERLKKELDALKEIVLKKEDSFNLKNNEENNNLYNQYPPPSAPNFSFQNNEEQLQDSSNEPRTPKILYKVMEQKPNEKSIDENFGKISDDKSKNEKKINEKKIYIPTTAITTGSLLHGLNAPTQMSQPMPTVVMIKDVAFLPNRKQLNIRECNLLIEGYGQLSDERAYFKFTKFVCVNNDGAKIYDTKASGYITSLVDNKQGLPGHVVSKQNEMLKRMFIAGMFEGASEMFKNTGQTQLTSPLGTTTTQSTSTSDRTNNLLGGGLGSASESAKELYLEKARNISETVEILAQDVGLVFTDGLVLEPLDLEKINKGEVDEKAN